MLRAMVDLVGQEPSLSDVRLLVVWRLAFAGFMHCDELLKLQCSDIAFGTESMTINITSSKTDQYREGSSLVVDRTGTPHARCTQEHGKAFWAVVCAIGGERLCKSGGVICYKRQNSWVWTQVYLACIVCGQVVPLLQ